LIILDLKVTKLQYGLTFRNRATMIDYWICWGLQWLIIVFIVEGHDYNVYFKIIHVTDILFSELIMYRILLLGIKHVGVF
jgi:hypothetical protein